MAASHPIEKHEAQLVNKLREIRARFLKNGGTLLSEDEILQEVHSRRGGIEVSMDESDS